MVHDVAYFLQINVWMEQQTQVFAKYVRAGADGGKTCEVADLQNTGEKKPPERTAVMTRTLLVGWLLGH